MEGIRDNSAGVSIWDIIPETPSSSASFKKQQFNLAVKWGEKRAKRLFYPSQSPLKAGHAAGASTGVNGWELCETLSAPEMGKP